MRFSGWRAAGSGEKVSVLMLALLVAVFAMGMLISVPAWSQEEQAEDESTGQEMASALAESTTPGPESTAADQPESTTPVSEDDAGQPSEQIDGGSQAEQGERQEAGAKVLQWDFQDQARESQSQLMQLEQTPDSLVGEIAITKDRGGDGQVDEVDIPRGGCTVQDGALITLQDEDGTTGDFEDGNNVEITATDNEVVMKEGPIPDDPDDNFGPINVQGGSVDGLNTQNLEVSASQGITCSLGEQPTPPPPGDTNACAQLNPPVEISQTTPAFGTIENRAGQEVPLRIVYATSSREGSLHITLRPQGGQATVDKTIEGRQRGVIETEVKPGATEVALIPENQGYTVVIEGDVGTGTEPCTSPGDLDVPAAPTDGGNQPGGGNPSNGGTGGAGEVIRETIPHRDLPDTGGMPLWPVAIVAIAVAGVGMALLRTRLPRG